MVAVIGSGTSIRKAFLYNQNKEKEGRAQCLIAANYPIEQQHLSPEQRLNMLLKTASLNPDCKRNSVHISLNFAPGEELSDARMRQIANTYMEMIGFGQQPFLVYRHYDAGHPHMHICTTNIRPDGTRIDTFNIGKLRSEPARKSIEEQFQLVRAEDHRQELYMPDPVETSRLVYGTVATKRAINNVLQNVLKNYKYTSLAELNAVLNQYNITATRGAPASRTYQHSGLLYRALDSEGRPVGVPVKASLFYNNPGLAMLEKKYLANDVARQQHKLELRNTIDLALRGRPDTLDAFVEKLRSKGIHVAVRKAETGEVYGLTYVDHRSKCVFNGSTLGKTYSAKGVLDRLAPITIAPAGAAPSIAQADQNLPSIGQTKVPAEERQQLEPVNLNPLIEGLLGYEYSPQAVPFDWKRRKKKKKKR